MATVQKKDKGLNKYSFRGLTPDQLNELTQEQVVELFRARMRRRYTRSNQHPIQKSNTNISDFTLNARKPKRILNPDKNQHPSRLISETQSSFPRWLETTSQSTVEKSSTTSKSSSIWSADISESSQLPTNPLDTVRPVSEPPRVQPTLPSSDCNIFRWLTLHSFRYYSRVELIYYYL